MRYIIVFIGCIVMCSNVLAQNYTKKNALSSDTLQVTEKVNIIAIPVIFYSPETSLGFGGGGQAFFLQKKGYIDSQVSTLFADVIYTLENQFIIDLLPKLYLQGGDYLLDIKFKYKIYPNKFWGIGSGTPASNEEPYNMTSLQFDISYLKHLPPILNFGVNYVFQQHDVTEVAEGGLLAGENIVGSNGTTVSGLGIVFNLDQRDSDIIPEKGYLMQFTTRVFTTPLGSKNNFYKYMIDLRKYYSLGQLAKSVLALRAYTEFSFGEVPFQMASWYGGGDRGRGYFRGRFIDNHLYILQSEFRYKFLKRWKLACFAGVGTVSEFKQISFDNMKWNIGGGIRFQLKKDNPSILRFDLGIGRDDNSGFYVGVNEAF